jgi:ketosteroid isomerase-like protein
MWKSRLHASNSLVDDLQSEVSEVPMKRFLSLFVLILCLALRLSAQTAPDASELTKLLQDFLAGASHNDVAMHDRFWADDLIYTRSAGRRIGKADVIRDVRAAPAPKPGSPTTTYTAEDIRIQQYGDAAVVAFRLVGTTNNEGKIEVTNFLNSGTFIKRNGKWQVVNWQSTRMARPEEDTKVEQEIMQLERDWSAAYLKHDTATIAGLLADDYVGIDGRGIVTNRADEIQEAAVPKPGTPPPPFDVLDETVSDMKVRVYGDMAVLNGRVTEKIKAKEKESEIQYRRTTVWVKRQGRWQCVSFHGSRILQPT